MRYIILSIFTAAALFCSPGSANAVTIYGSAYIGGGASTLYTIDPTTGLATAVGTGIGYDRVGAMDFDPGTGILSLHDRLDDRCGYPCWIHQQRDWEWQWPRL